MHIYNMRISAHMYGSDCCPRAGAMMDAAGRGSGGGGGRVCVCVCVGGGGGEQARRPTWAGCLNVEGQP